MDNSASVLDTVFSADLSPTQHLLLKHFIEKADDSESAARYLNSRIQQSENVEDYLRAFKHDWRRLVFKLTHLDPIPENLDVFLSRRIGPSCSLSRNEKGDSDKAGAESAYIIPPSFVQSIESDQRPLVEILEAFLSTPKVVQLKTLLAGQDELSSLRNLWRLSPSMHQAFRHGHINIRSMACRRAEMGFPPEECEHDEDPTTEYSYTMRTLYPEEPTGLFLGDGEWFDRAIWYFKFSTPDAAAMSLPDTFLFDVHRAFATALHLFSIEDKISLEWPKPSRSWISPFIRKAFFYFSRFVPLWDCFKAPENEPNALKLVEKHTSIPAPSLVDVYEHDGNTYMVMTHIPGQSLAHVGHLFSYAERDRLADDLAACVAQLRTIPNITPYKFGDTLGGPIIDHRIPDDRGGPFNTEADFNDHLVSHLACSIYDAVDGLPIRQDHRSFFTHGDFHATNLLIEGGRLSGIIDWECAGYMPEYWEFTKAMYTSNWKPIQQAIFYRAFGHEYDDELAAELKLWALTPFGV